MKKKPSNASLLVHIWQLGQLIHRAIGGVDALSLPQYRRIKVGGALALSARHNLREAQRDLRELYNYLNGLHHS